MKPILLDYLVCPACQSELDCDVSEQVGEEIVSGSLRCPQCKLTYPITRGIPRFIDPQQGLSPSNPQTANAFGWEWQEFRELHNLKTYQKQFLDWVKPIPPEYFKDKIVLDAGCGMGRWALVCDTLGAGMVLSVDVSEGIEAAYDNTREAPAIHVVQADIYHLPLRRGPQAQIDFAYSIGVLHHLDDPQGGFNALVCHLQTSGSIFAWVYGRENNDWLVNIIDPIRKTITSVMPHFALYLISWLMTLFLHPVLKWVYWPVNQWDGLASLKKLLPYNDYFAWLASFGFRHTHSVVFDHLVAPVAFYIRREEISAWFDEAGLEIIDLTWRNRNSWGVHGRFKAQN
ncbi:MAG: methyltransferase domain-containing protein [Anaerolineae bacterium]|nr:methyltransferase domain-containing protein [Anaerolineae bacterium]